MMGIWALAVNELRLNLRDPLMVFWSLAFPGLWLIMMAGVLPPIPGFEHGEMGNGSLFLPAAVSIAVVSSAFIGVPQTLTTYRETGVLRRFRAAPVRTISLVAGFSISQFCFMGVGIAVLFALGLAAFGARIIGSIPALLGVLMLGMVTFLSIGAAVGSVAGSARTANVIIWVAFLPMMWLSELFLPLSILPSWLQYVARALPLTALTTLMRDIVYGVPLAAGWRLGVLGVWAALGPLLIARCFRWE